MEKLIVPLTALYETDIQYDFCVREGALFVRALKPKITLPYGAEAILPNIFAIHGYADKKNWIKMGSADRHFYSDAELIRNAGGAFDDHCMNGTWGQLRLKELEPQKDFYVQCKEGPMLELKEYTTEQLKRYAKKASKGEAQLIFEKQSYDVGTNPNFKKAMRLLVQRGLRNIVFNGVATDYCVKAAVLRTADIKERYFPKLGIYVVKDAIEAVNINFKGQPDHDFGNKALVEMVANGAKLVTTREILEGRVR